MTRFCEVDVVKKFIDRPGVREEMGVLGELAEAGWLEAVWSEAENSHLIPLMTEYICGHLQEDTQRLVQRLFEDQETVGPQTRKKIRILLFTAGLVWLQRYHLIGEPMYQLVRPILSHIFRRGERDTVMYGISMVRLSPVEDSYFDFVTEF